MLIINRENKTIVELVGSLSVAWKYQDSVNKEATQIYENIMEKRYNYGTTENAKIHAIKTQEKFLSTQPKTYLIVMNGLNRSLKEFDSEERVNECFELIVQAILSNKNFVIVG